MSPKTGTDNSGETVKSTMAWAVQFLAEKRADAPRLTAELLLAYVLGWERIRVISHPEESLAPAFVREFRHLVQRRALGEPLQYLTGEREFYGLSFHVTPAVLIPRPETEILVEQAVESAHSLWKGGAISFVDVGTGSGCIAIAFAVNVPQARGWAVDLSAEALTVARSNAKRHDVAARVELVRGDLLDWVAPQRRFGLILANAPYVARREASALSAAVLDHEPGLALFGGESGLEIYARLIPRAARCLSEGGRLLLEIGAGQADAVRSMLGEAGLGVEQIAGDLQGIPRCIVAALEGEL